MKLVQLIYASRTSGQANLDIIHDILVKAVPHNQSKGITGFLAFDGSCFLQAIEGGADEVLAEAAHRDASPVPRVDLHRPSYPLNLRVLSVWGWTAFANHMGSAIRCNSSKVPLTGVYSVSTDKIPMELGVVATLGEQL